MDKTDAMPQPDKYDELIAMLRNDPDFHRLPLPEFVRKRYDIPLVCNELSIKAATAKAFGSPSS